MNDHMVKWDQLGLILAPQETEEEYQRRVRYCLNQVDEVEKELKLTTPFLKTEEEKNPYFVKAFQKTEKLFKIKPSWVPLLFHNQKLSFWHAGCALIYQLTEKKPLSSFLQLRKIFQKKDKYLFFYKRDEVVAHEMAHIGRMAFDEPKFEEIFAYLTADSGFRSYFGPLFPSSKEASIFSFLFFIPLVFSFFSFYDARLSFWALWTLFIPFFFLLFLSISLIRKQTILKKCLKNLRDICHEEKNVIPLAYRLSDQEIQLFSQTTEDFIVHFMKEKAKTSFRWAFLEKEYVQKSF